MESPAASSLALLILCPEESLSDAEDKASLERLRFRWTVWERMLLPIVTATTTTNTYIGTGIEVGTIGKSMKDYYWCTKKSPVAAGYTNQ